jgi:hypothetical protein
MLLNSFIIHNAKKMIRGMSIAHQKNILNAECAIPRIESPYQVTIIVSDRSIAPEHVSEV